MRRILAAAGIMLLILSLSVTAFAVGSAQRVQSQAYVSNDGSCQVSLTVLISVDTPSDNLAFPIPANARNVTLNGSAARTRHSGDALFVYLGNNYAPTITYTLTDLISRNDLDQLVLTLPLLSGFDYPVDSLEFRVTLPDTVTSKPAFTSVYYQKSIEESLTVTVDGAEIYGVCSTTLKDQESITMTLPVSEEMFPQTIVEEWTIGIAEIAMIALAVLAAAYWLLTMRCLPPRRVRCSQPPEGYAAGELGCALIGQGADLTMMVLSWASMGYILIHLDDSGRVVLHKRMEMGNERDSFEVKTFRALFAKRQMVDGTGYHYAQLYRRTAAKRPGLRDLCKRRSGNPRVFRVLAALAGAFGGYSLGEALAGNALLGGLLIAVLMLLGGISAWFIQELPKALHLRGWDSLFIALLLCLAWLILGFAAGTVHIALWVVVGELLAGLMWAYGGMRTELGRQTRSQILGLRRYLRTVKHKELQRICRSNPEYFFTMMPYAMALGVDKVFARSFGPGRLPACPYLTTGMDGHMNAAEWQQLMRRAVNALDARQKRLFWDRLFGK